MVVSCHFEMIVPILLLLKSSCSAGGCVNDLSELGSLLLLQGTLSLTPKEKTWSRLLGFFTSVGIEPTLNFSTETRGSVHLYSDAYIISIAHA